MTSHQTKRIPSAISRTPEIVAIPSKPSDNMHPFDIGSVGRYIAERINVKKIIDEHKLNEEHLWTDKMEADIIPILNQFCSDEVREHCEKHADLDVRLQKLSEDLSEYEGSGRESSSEASKLVWSIYTVDKDYQGKIEANPALWEAFENFVDLAHPDLKKSDDVWIEILQVSAGSALKDAVQFIYDQDEADAVPEE